MRDSSDQETHLEAFKQATAATMRALSGKPDLEVSFGQGLLIGEGNQVRVPIPTPPCSERQCMESRGCADEYALRLKHHDSRLHGQLAPDSATGRKIFDFAENARIATIGTRHMIGIAANLDNHLDAECVSYGSVQDFCNDQDILGVALGLLVREKLTARCLPPYASRIVELWRGRLGNLDGKFDSLSALVEDQRAFALQVRQIIAGLEFTDDPELPPDTGQKEGMEHIAEDQGPSDQSRQDQLLDDESGQPSGGMDPQPAQAQMPDNPEPDQTGEAGEAGETPETESGPVSPEGLGNYTVYTTRYDEVIRALELCSAEEMSRLRVILDQKLQPLQQATSRLANRLQRWLLAKQTRSWEFGLEEGILDCARLSRVVANPNHTLAYKKERDTDFRDTVVSLLIDSSGSMRGHSIATAAMCADILGCTLERCSVKVEILGFTTRAWRGGQSREKWLADGKPANPGRLNDLRHIIYKAANEPWRWARRNLGLMMHEELLKENIDGEALLWAHGRLMTCEEQRKILMIISDGLPVDNSTLLTNQSNYLERHLEHAVELIENHSPVELTAIGIGHDVTHHYQRAVTIMHPDQLAGAMVKQFVHLFDMEQTPRKDRRGRAVHPGAAGNDPRGISSRRAARGRPEQRSP